MNLNIYIYETLFSQFVTCEFSLDIYLLHTTNSCSPRKHWFDIISIGLITQCSSLGNNDRWKKIRVITYLPYHSRKRTQTTYLSVWWIIQNFTWKTKILFHNNKECVNQIINIWYLFPKEEIEYKFWDGIICFLEILKIPPLFF